MKLDQWAASLLVDPITKIEKTFDDFKKINGIVDARVF